jgi:signal transduction histidine kinase
MAERIESDVTELHRQDKMRRDLIANIAHDLATPLTAIQGFSEALADDVITDPQARQETAQLIGREVQRLRRMVSDMQQMTSLESGRIQLDQEPLDLHTLVDEVLEVILPECDQVGIFLRNEIDPTTPSVLADSDRMTQVLLNLLDNARRYTPAGGSITIGASLNDSDLQTRQQLLEVSHARHAQAGQQPDESVQTIHTQASTRIANDVGALNAKRSDKLIGDGALSHFGYSEVPMDGKTKWLTVWLRDTGTGIDPKDLPYIFDRFFRSDRSRSGASGGSGLGLAIIKAIITAHGGTICAESTPGKGTCITFTLPLA